MRRRELSVVCDAGRAGRAPGPGVAAWRVFVKYVNYGFSSTGRRRARGTHATAQHHVQLNVRLEREQRRQQREHGCKHQHVER